MKSFPVQRQVLLEKIIHFDEISFSRSRKRSRIHSNAAKSSAITLLLIKYTPWDLKSIVKGAVDESVELRELIEALLLSDNSDQDRYKNLQLSLFDVSSLLMPSNVFRRYNSDTILRLMGALFPLKLMQNTDFTFSSYAHSFERCKSKASFTHTSNSCQIGPNICVITVGNVSSEALPKPMDTAVSNTFSYDYPLIYYHYFISLAPETATAKSKIELKKSLQCCFCKGCIQSENAFIIREAGKELGISVETCQAIESLCIHLRSHHPHFHFELFFDQYHNMHIVLRRVCELSTSEVASSKNIFLLNEGVYDMYAMYSNQLRTFYRQQIRSGLSMLPLYTHSQILRKSRVHPDFFYLKKAIPPFVEVTKEAEITSPTTSSKANSQRQYYHMRTGLPLLPTELQYDSEDDEAVHQQAILQRHRVLEEFEDVTQEEKELMKLWNSFTARHPVYSVAYFMSHSLVPFVHEFGDGIVEKKLRYQFLLHLLGLWDFGLIRKEDITRLVNEIDRKHLALELHR